MTSWGLPLRKPGRGSAGHHLPPENSRRVSIGRGLFRLWWATRKYGQSSLPWKVVGVLWLSVLSLFWQTTANAQTVDPIVAGESALRSTRAPWYDVETDSIRIVSLDKESAAGERQDWRDNRPKRPAWKWEWDWDWWDWSGQGRAGGGGFRFPTFGEAVQTVGWLVLVALLAALIFFLVRNYVRAEQPRAAGTTGDHEDDDRTDEQRIRELPVPVVAGRGDFLSMATMHYEQGQLADAIVYLFSHRLIQLDRAGFIRLTRGKTNRQYLVELASMEELRRIVGNTILCFEDVFFGKHTLQRARFESIWQDNTRFDAIVQSASERVSR